MNAFKITTIFFFTLLITLQVNSQNNFKKDSADVHQVILNLFDGMRAGDSTKVHFAFYNKVSIYTSYKSKTGEKQLKKGSLDNFLNAIGTPHIGIWDERISNTVIQIDGNLAQVWTYYAFYIDDKFSHCGVDAFQLVKDKKDNWKIMNLIDTRRMENCIINN